MKSVRLDARATLRKRNQRREFALHTAAVELLQVAYPQLMIWHTPNGELRDEGTGRKLAAMGVRPGVLDIAILVPPHGRMAFIEIKAPGEKPSDDQRLFIDDAIQRGAVCAVADNLEGVIAALTAWGIQPRNRFALDGKVA